MRVRAEAEKRADALLAKMTLDEKLTLVGGINDSTLKQFPDWAFRNFACRMARWGCMTTARRRLIPLRLR